MRFDPIATKAETVVIRVRIPIELQARYEAVAEKNHMDVAGLYVQALAFAGGDDPSKATATTRKKRKKTSKEADLA